MNAANSYTASLLCTAIYYMLGYFDKIFDNDAVYAGYKLHNGEHTLTCRGSETFEDWYNDLESLGTTEHPILGRVGKGFIEGIDDTFEAIKLYGIPLDATIKIYGHSLGGAHAIYLAGLFINAGYKIELVIIEAPRSCGAKLLTMLAPYPVSCYRNGSDFVTQIPLTLEQPGNLIPLNCPPVSGDITPFRFHHMPLIVTALALQQEGICGSDSF